MLPHASDGVRAQEAGAQLIFPSQTQPTESQAEPYGVCLLLCSILYNLPGLHKLVLHRLPYCVLKCVVWHANAHHVVLPTLQCTIFFTIPSVMY